MLRMLVAAAAITAALALFRAPTIHAGSTPGQIELVAIDTDPIGNQPNGPLGPVDSCREVAVGETFTVDVIVDEIDPADALDAFQYVLTYDSSLLKVTGHDTASSIVLQVGTTPVDFSNAVPDSDGEFLAALIDFSPAGDREFGKGILSSVSLEAISSGFAFLSLAKVLIGNSDAAPPYVISPDEARGATVIVGGSGTCSATGADPDEDGICNPGLPAEYCTGSDNCPNDANPGQANADSDGKGDICDPCPNAVGGEFDNDVDGVLTCVDVCPLVEDPGQEDSNDNGVGDACEVMIAITGSSLTCPETVPADVFRQCDVTIEVTNIGSKATSVKTQLLFNASNCAVLGSIQIDNEDVPVGGHFGLTFTSQFSCHNAGTVHPHVILGISVADPLVDATLGDNAIEMTDVVVVIQSPSTPAPTTAATPTTAPTPTPVPTSQEPRNLAAGTKTATPAALPASGGAPTADGGIDGMPVPAIGLGGAALIASALFARRRRD